MNGLFEQDEQLSKARLCTLLAALLGATIMLFPAVQAAARSAPALDPVRLYGPGIEFDVLRNGVKSGLHRVSFAFEAGTLSVKTEFRLQIDVLFVTLYRFTYSSVDLWRDDALEAVRVEIDDDGIAKSIQARRAGARYAIDAGGVAYLAAPPLYPTNHWHAGVLTEGRVLNTLSGRINTVRIERRAREAVATERGTIVATRYSYIGDLDTEVWYDDAGRWVKLRFKGTDGSLIEYACRRCQGPGTSQAAR